MTGDRLRTKDMDHLSTVIREETVVMKVFDFDNTIYRGESSIDLAVYKAEQQSTTSIGASAPHGCG